VNLLEKAYRTLYPESEATLQFILNYSNKFRSHGGKIQINTLQRTLSCTVSARWKDVTESIQMGFLQALIAKLNKTKKKTLEIDLYHQYMHQLSTYAPKQTFDPLISEAFNEVNTHYFGGSIEKPNLVWRKSKNPLGTYEYATDTVSISRHLASDKELLQYVLYHELLHKKHGYKTRGTRMCSHDAAFRADEHKFENWQQLEKRLSQLVVRKASFWSWMRT